MKALDILNRLQDEQPMYFENEVAEAIAELEALQEPKTCEYCRFFHLRMDGFNYCDRHSLMNGLVYSDFGCIHFEPKDK